MTENMKKFLEAMSKDEALRKKATTMGKEDLLAMAKELGIDLTEADFAQPEGEMNANELDAVAGGGACACVTLGAGTYEGKDNACGCYIYGTGDASSSEERCFCVYGGYGDSVEG